MTADIEQLILESRFLAQQSRRLQRQSRAVSLRLVKLLCESRPEETSLARCRSQHVPVVRVFAQSPGDHHHGAAAAIEASEALMNRVRENQLLDNALLDRSYRLVRGFTDRPSREPVPRATR